MDKSVINRRSGGETAVVLSSRRVIVVFKSSLLSFFKIIRNTWHKWRTLVRSFLQFILLFTISRISAKASTSCKNWDWHAHLPWHVTCTRTTDVINRSAHQLLSIRDCQTLKINLCDVMPRNNDKLCDVYASCIVRARCIIELQRSLDDKHSDVRIQLSLTDLDWFINLSYGVEKITQNR